MGIFDVFSSGQQQPQVPTGQSQSNQVQDLIPFYSNPAGAELGKMMLETDSFVQRIRMQLRGWIETTPGQFEHIGAQLMNDKGASTIATLLDGYVRKETFLSKIDEYDKVRITRDIWVTIRRMIVKNMDEWQIPYDKGRWTLIREIVTDQIYFALSRAQDGVEKRFFADTHQSKTISSADMQHKFNEKRGFWG